MDQFHQNFSGTIILESLEKSIEYSFKDEINKDRQNVLSKEGKDPEINNEENIVKKKRGRKPTITKVDKSDMFKVEEWDDILWGEDLANILNEKYNEDWLLFENKIIKDGPRIVHQLIFKRIKNE